MSETKEPDALLSVEQIESLWGSLPSVRMMLDHYRTERARAEKAEDLAAALYEKNLSKGELASLLRANGVSADVIASATKSNMARRMVRIAVDP